MKQLLTIGQIATKLGLPIHRIDYLINSRHIEPVARAGQFRVFDDAAVNRIEREVADTRHGPSAVTA